MTYYIALNQYRKLDRKQRWEKACLVLRRSEDTTFSIPTHVQRRHKRRQSRINESRQQKTHARMTIKMKKKLATYSWKIYIPFSLKYKWTDTEMYWTSRPTEWQRDFSHISAIASRHSDAIFVCINSRPDIVMPSQCNFLVQLFIWKIISGSITFLFEKPGDFFFIEPVEIKPKIWIVIVKCIWIGALFWFTGSIAVSM